MYLSSLSPVLREAVLSSSSEQINYLHTVDSSALKQFFCEKVVDSLINKRKMLVVIPDGMPSSVPAKLLSPHQLAHYTMHYNRDESISDTQIQRLQKLRKLAEINTESGAYKKSKQRFSEVNKKITDLLSIINSETDQGPSLKDLILNNVDDPQVYLPKHIGRLISDMAIDDRTLRSLDRLQSSHKPYFNFISNSAPISELALSDRTSRQLAIEEVTSLTGGLASVVKSLEQDLESAYKTLERSIMTECQVWVSIKKELELAIFNNDLSDGATSFESSYTEVMAPAKKLFYLRLDLERKPELNWGEAQLILQGIDGLIAGVKSSLETHFKSLLKRMTPFNIVKPELRDIVDKCMSIIRAINKSSYLSIEIPQTYLQIGELKKQINKAYNQLRLAHNALTDDQYCDYVILSHQVGINDEILSYFLQVDDISWRSVVNYRVRQHLIDNRYEDEINSLEKLYASLKPIMVQKSKTGLTELHNIWSMMRDKAITDIKNTQWDLYKDIWTDAKSDLSSAELFALIPEALTSFCPITVVFESALPHLLEENNSPFYEVLFLDNRELQTKVLSHTYNYIQRITVATSYDIDITSTLDPQLSVRSFYSSDLKMPEQSINGIDPGSDRYRQILPVATSLCDLMKSVTIYRMTNQVIYSFADGQINQLVEEQLNLSTRNILYRDATDISSIVECLMLDLDHVIITEDSVINANLTEDLSWQRETITAIEKIGVSIVNLDFSDLYANPQLALNRLCSSLLPQPADEETAEAVHVKSQLALS